MDPAYAGFRKDIAVAGAPKSTSEFEAKIAHVATLRKRAEGTDDPAEAAGVSLFRRHGFRCLQQVPQRSLLLSAQAH